MSTITSAPSALPIIDVAKLVPTHPEYATEIARLGQAAHEVGFFYVRDHGIAPSVVQDLMAQAQEFFARPEAERLEIDNLNSPQFRGYTRTGNERTQGKQDWRDQLDIGPEEPARTLAPTDPDYFGLIGPNQWPSAQPSLRPAIETWWNQAERVSVQLLAALAVSLGQPASIFDEWFGERSHSFLKLIHYPGRDHAEKQGVGSHKDYGFLTLLLQDNHGGLQVQTDAGEWIDAPPIPGTFIVNVGEMLEIASSGYLKATVHRVLSPRAGIHRYSSAFFYGPRLDAVIPPITLPVELAAQATGITEDPDNPLLAAYGANTLKGWLRAHPQVAQRWWNSEQNRAAS